MGRVETIKAKHEKQIVKLFKSHLHGEIEPRKEKMNSSFYFFNDHDGRQQTLKMLYTLLVQIVESAACALPAICKCN